MARFESIVHAHFFHITWEDDCLAFHFAKSKTDQMGRNRDQVWHVYATPNSVCPVLALVTYIFANPSITNVNNSTKTDEDGNCSGHVFPGGDQYGQFMDCLCQVVEKNQGVFFVLGIHSSDLASHSAWKRACSFAVAGSTVCPPMVSVCF